MFLGSRATGSAFACLAGYLILQLAYTCYLKRVVIIDVMVIAAGFVLRAVAGACAIEVVISPWLLICTSLLSLFLALSKRRSELMFSGSPAEHRAVLSDYNQPFLYQLIAVVTAGTLLAYVLYTYSEQTMQRFPSHFMPATLPLVFYGLSRYLYLIYKRGEGGEPELLLVGDLPLLTSIALWAASVAVIVKVGGHS